jgi:hypothetical protein
VTSVTGTNPIVVTSGATPNVSLSPNPTITGNWTANAFLSSLPYGATSAANLPFRYPGNGATVTFGASSSTVVGPYNIGTDVMGVFLGNTGEFSVDSNGNIANNGNAYIKNFVESGGLCAATSQGGCNSNLFAVGDVSASRGASSGAMEFGTGTNALFDYGVTTANQFTLSGASAGLSALNYTASNAYSGTSFFGEYIGAFGGTNYIGANSSATGAAGCVPNAFGVFNAQSGGTALLCLTNSGALTTIAGIEAGTYLCAGQNSCGSAAGDVTSSDSTTSGRYYYGNTNNINYNITTASTYVADAPFNATNLSSKANGGLSNAAPVPPCVNFANGLACASATFVQYGTITCAFSSSTTCSVVATYSKNYTSSSNCTVTVISTDATYTATSSFGGTTGPTVYFAHATPSSASVQATLYCIGS